MYTTQGEKETTTTLGVYTVNKGSCNSCQKSRQDRDHNYDHELRSWFDTCVNTSATGNITMVRIGEREEGRKMGKKERRSVLTGGRKGRKRGV